MVRLEFLCPDWHHVGLTTDNWGTLDVQMSPFDLTMLLRMLGKAWTTATLVAVTLVANAGSRAVADDAFVTLGPTVGWQTSRGAIEAGAEIAVWP